MVAKDLIGKILCVDDFRARIIETEPYKQDKASHAYKKTQRSEIMYNTYGHIYVYLIYGMHFCLNFTTDTKPGAVLIRALDHPDCTGPGKICRKLKITGVDNKKEIGQRIKIFDDGYKTKIICTERIGITKDTRLKWRFIKKT